MKSIFLNTLFALILVGFSGYYDYHRIVFKRPQSVHKWRQSDCASIALNYYQDGMHFFAPETHNLTSDGGTTGKCCTSEVPILYYSVALLYKVFGYHDYIYRIFNALLFFLGLFYLFRFFRYLLNDNFWAIALTLLFFTSPVLVYYGNNFLSNSSSLAFSIIGWYYFLRFSFERTQGLFYKSMVIFALAAAFKVTALFSLFAISGSYMLHVLGFKVFSADGRPIDFSARFVVHIVSVFALIGLWLMYAHNFNQEHGCSYFSTTIFPIWSLSPEDAFGVLTAVQKVWLDDYFHPSALLFVAGCLLLSFVFFRKSNKLLFYCVLFVIAEELVYVALQFWTFANHDYYVIDMYILPVLIVAASFDVLARHFAKVFKSYWLKAGFTVLLAFGFLHAKEKVSNRYEHRLSVFPEKQNIYHLTPYLREIGVTRHDTIISIPDQSHVTLYLMNQKGWTEYTDAKFNRGDAVPYNSDSAGIQHSINKGARYMVINGIQELYKKPYLRSFCTHLIGQYESVLIFDLRREESNFSLMKRLVEAKYTCDAETLNVDSHFFVTGNDSSLFWSGLTQSADMAHGGMYSAKLDANSPYGMTINLSQLKVGQSFAISVWRKSIGKAKGGLMATSGPNEYYNSESRVLEHDSADWEKVFLEFFIPKRLDGQALKVYLFNPEKEPVYFDDLEIVRYRSVLTGLEHE